MSFEDIPLRSNGDTEVTAAWWNTIRSELVSLLPNFSGLTTKGDILVRTAAGLQGLAVGANGLVLKANSATTTGLEWTNDNASAILNIADISSTTTASTSVNLYNCDTSGGAFTVTLPTAVGNTGITFTFKKTNDDSNLLTIDGDGSETINGQPNQILRSMDASLVIYSDGANWKVLSTQGDFYETSDASERNVTSPTLSAWGIPSTSINLALRANSTYNIWAHGMLRAVTTTSSGAIYGALRFGTSTTAGVSLIGNQTTTSLFQQGSRNAEANPFNLVLKNYTPASDLNIYINVTAVNWSGATSLSAVGLRGDQQPTILVAERIK